MPRAAWEDSIRGRSAGLDAEQVANRSRAAGTCRETVGHPGRPAGRGSRVASRESVGVSATGEREARGVGRVGCPSRSPPGEFVCGSREVESACECGRGGAHGSHLSPTLAASRWSLPPPLSRTLADLRRPGVVRRAVVRILIVHRNATPSKTNGNFDVPRLVCPRSQLQPERPSRGVLPASGAIASLPPLVIAS